jgi:hypothetical protein
MTFPEGIGRRVPELTADDVERWGRRGAVDLGDRALRAAAALELIGGPTAAALGVVAYGLNIEFDEAETAGDVERAANLSCAMNIVLSRMQRARDAWKGELGRN